MSHKILLIDDEQVVTRALKRALMSEPYKVLSTDSAQKALMILQQESIDVVVSDEQMPGMCGNEFLASIKSDYPDIIRIMLTGNAESSTAMRAINEGGVYRFLSKPCSGLDLAITLRHAILYKDILAKSRSLLKTTIQQFNLLQALEAKQPGITRVGKDKINAGTKLSPKDNFDTLIDKIIEQLTKSDIFLESASMEPIEA